MKKSTWVLIAFVIGIFGGGLLYRHLAQDIDSRGATRLMRALEENDADNLDKWLNEEEIAMQDKAGQTPLFYAAKHALQPQVIHKLLLAGADPFVQDRAGNTPLMVAARYNSEPLIVLTLARQGGSDTQQHNKNQALKLAARYNTAPVIKMLLMAQANPVGGRHEKSAAEFLEENERLTEREKNDLRQVMMLLEILQGRKDFMSLPAGAEKTTKLLKAEAVNTPSSVTPSKKSTETNLSVSSSSQETAKQTQLSRKATQEQTSSSKDTSVSSQEVNKNPN